MFFFDPSGVAQKDSALLIRKPLHFLSLGFSFPCPFKGSFPSRSLGGRSTLGSTLGPPLPPSYRTGPSPIDTLPALSTTQDPPTSHLSLRVP